MNIMKEGENLKQSILGEDVYYFREDANDFFGISHFGKTLPKADYSAVHCPSAYHLIEYVLSDVGYIERSGTVEQLHAGDLCLLNKNSRMRCFSDPGQPYTKYFLTICGTLADQLVAAFYDDIDFRIIHTGSRHDRIENDFSALIKLMTLLDTEEKTDVHADGMAEASALIYRIMLDSVGSKPFLSQNPVSTLASQARRMMDETVTEHINVTDIAGRLHISTAHLIRVFRKRYGVTPKQYMLVRRIAHAQTLLRSTQMSVSEIAEVLHFADTAYFASVFHKITDMTPTGFREHAQSYLSRPQDRSR